MYESRNMYGTESSASTGEPTPVYVSTRAEALEHKFSADIKQSLNSCLLDEYKEVK